jgi:hypothetical protein
MLLHTAVITLDVTNVIDDCQERDRHFKILTQDSYDRTETSHKASVNMFAILVKIRIEYLLSTELHLNRYTS